MKYPVLILLTASLLHASDLVEICTATHSILALHFDDGTVDHYGLGQDGNDDVLYRSPLSTTRAAQTENYSICSAGDPNYATPLSPLSTGRKTKGNDFSKNWGQGQPYVKEHWIYLELPFPLQSGNSYHLEFNYPLAKNGTKWDFTFDEKHMRSETIHVNQIGYAPVSPQKYAYLSHWLGDMGPLDLENFKNTEFHLYDMLSETIVYSDRIKKRKDLETGGPDGAYDEHAPHGSFTGADVWLADFTEFTTPGNYKLVVDGIGCSYPFRIDNDAYREAFYTTARALYHQRCGIALEAPYTEWIRGRCHHPAETDTVILSEWMYMDGRNAFTQLPQTATDVKKSYFGGWHDAADWDRHHYHLDAGIKLMTVYEMRPENFSDDELNIPESSNGLPDILDEARWCVDFYKSMQEPDGGIHGGIETHRHPGNGISSVTDTDQWYAYAPDPIASFHYAAAACHLARCLQIAESGEDITAYIESAEQAFQWAMDNTNPEDMDKQNIRDMRHYASAWLLRQTAKPEYLTRFKADNMVTSADTELEKWQSHDQQWGIYTYCMAEGEHIDEDLKTMLIKAVEKWAHSDHMDNADRRGYQFGNDWWLPISWGHATRCRVFPVTMAYYLTGKEDYLGYHYTACDYILGANPLNMCWVTGIGEKFPKEVMHLDSWYYNTEKGMVPGLVPFGPAAYTDDHPDGTWEISWGMQTAYPPAEEWPSHELYFENRYCPPMNEFTVHATIGPAAAAFGFLCEPGGKFTTARQQHPAPVTDFKLLQNYPNPFNPVTTIEFELERPDRVLLRVFNMQGRLVKTLFDAHRPAGHYTIQWDGRDTNDGKAASGVYLTCLQVGHQKKTVKMALVR